MPSEAGFPPHQVASGDLPSNPQTRSKRSAEGQTPRTGPKPSRESTISNVSPALQNDGHIRNDITDGEKTPATFRIENSAGVKRGILRHGQVDAYDMSATLPAEKGFPIQIGSELFRLSGASIMSDGQSPFHHNRQNMESLRVLEHPHTFPSFLRRNYIGMETAV
jgi:hypothetical protein